LRAFDCGYRLKPASLFTGLHDGLLAERWWRDYPHRRFLAAVQAKKTQPPVDCYRRHAVAEADEFGH
jgi:hypothetical protein